MSKKTKIIILSIIGVILIAILVVFVNMTLNKNKEPEAIVKEELVAGEKEEKEEKKSIYEGNSRPIAVMIDNNENAYPQSGINDAYLVYEIVVEGNETRLMALFKNMEIDAVRTNKKC